MKRFNRLQTRLSFAFAAMALTLIIILSGVIGFKSINQIQLEIGNSLGEVAYLMGNNLDQYMWSRYGETDIISELDELKNPDSKEKIQSQLDGLKAAFPAFSWIGFTDRNGIVLASTDNILNGADISERPVFANSVENKYVGDVHEAVLLADLLPNPTGEDMKFVDIGTPVTNAEGEFVGVLAAHLSWQWVQEVKDVTQQRLKNREGLEFFVISKENNDVLLGPDELLGTSLDLKSIDLARQQGNGWTREKWGDGKEYLTGYVSEGGYKDYPGLGWTILIRQPIEVAYAPAMELFRYFLISGAVLVLIFAIIGWLAADRISAPIQRISKVADGLREGRAVEIPPYKGMWEIEVLTASLRSLLANLSWTEKALEHMEETASTDNLTGLPNRNGLDRHLEKASRDSAELTVLFLDLDGFKEVNDTFGHHAGDELLRQVAGRLTENSQPGSFVSRVGGDEFILIVDPETSSESAMAIGEGIISRLNERYIIEGHAITVGCSIGSAVWQTGGDISEVIQYADALLYEAKRAGKNRLYFHDQQTFV